MDEIIRQSILQFKLDGKTYKEIAAIFNCSILEIKRIVDPDYDQRSLNRLKYLHQQDRDFPLRKKVRQFLQFTGQKNKTVEVFYNDLIKKIGNNPKCYLTGREVNLKDPSTYSLDHIIPISKGGLNTLENCGLLCAEANKAKHDKTPEEFFFLMEEIFNHLGYELVIKQNGAYPENPTRTNNLTV